MVILCEELVKDKIFLIFLRAGLFVLGAVGGSPKTGTVLIFET
jgi:hypothetical protein